VSAALIDEATDDDVYAAYDWTITFDVGGKQCEGTKGARTNVSGLGSASPKRCPSSLPRWLRTV
jgi:hypothetical protein